MYPLKNTQTAFTQISSPILGNKSLKKYKLATSSVSCGAGGKRVRTASGHLAFNPVKDIHPNCDRTLTSGAQTLWCRGKHNWGLWVSYVWHLRHFVVLNCATESYYLM